MGDGGTICRNIVGEEALVRAGRALEFAGDVHRRYSGFLRQDSPLRSTMVGLSEEEKYFIHGGIAQDIRTDGRQRLQFRALSVETGFIASFHRFLGLYPSVANGSARVRLGGTEVIASVKAELGKPSILIPNRGKVNIFVDCSPTAEPTFQVCWDLYIDGLVISSDGNLVGTLAAAIKVALSDTGIPKVNVSVGAASDDESELDVSDEEFLQFDTSSVPVIITLTEVGGQYFVDATSEEESQISSAVSVSVNRHGDICGVTKRGGTGLDSEIAAAQAEE
ncbi:hypothetical protein PR202_gb03132 [Eleusine coracana subsp. coracana]|uniref:Ribosomal RNA-processing protein 42 n=1 Tax=Eleusine coracana subsp. coracana TaxID=191504 RepID=A0AAV5E0E2_ELECO|nr:hypothetical protein PR202_gb03132 [Eleusine coracana subsp. coracana]